ncbi:TPA: hypothetical protein ACGQTY_002509 [Citrobacter farmeri]|uniref:Uncharacterized protein n=1 Tax=Citrobacter amalonaticus TaxID=35703 RepID=A0AAX2BEH4_CITAM|nr:hypothetical protein [Citrobacter amalonaticus]QZA35380.1 hypothetical protein K1713_17290 [Citrobacter amalonaticus]SAZ04555.1 conserved protein of unknown function [Citrobacter amalonaticus]
MNNVTGCQFQDNGTRRVWFFRDNSQAVEYTTLPPKLRFKYWDACNRPVRAKDQQSEMKKAIEQFKKLRGIK